MKRLLLGFCLLLPAFSWAQKRNVYTFDFTNYQSLNPAFEYLNPDYNGAEINLDNTVLRSNDGLIQVTFIGRSDDGLSACLKTGWPQNDEETIFDHFLMIRRAAGMKITGNGVDIDTLTFSQDSYTANLAVVSPIGVGLVSPVNFSWYSKGAQGVRELHYVNNGNLPEIRSFTVIYRSPMDILVPVNVNPANESELHSVETIELAYGQAIKLSTSAKFELTGPRGFNPILMNANVVGNKVVLSLPDGVTIDEATVARRGDYTLTIAAQSIIGDDEDGYYNKKTVYTFKVVEAFNKFESDVIYPDMAANIEKIDTIVLGFPAEIGKFSADELKLVDREGNNVRTVQAKWLKDEEYTAARPFFKGDRDIYNYVQFVFSGSKTAPVKASGIYTLTIPEGFIWNNKYDATLEDEGTSVGARFNPEITLEYNVNGVVYPSDEVLQAAKDLLAVTGAGYPAADSPARLALQTLIEEGVGADAVFEEAMEAFYAETDIEMPSEGYYLLSAVGPNGGAESEAFVSYRDGQVGLTREKNDAVHLLAYVNDEGSVIFETPDHKYLTQLFPSGSNVTTVRGKSNDLTFSRFILPVNEEGVELKAKDLFGLWNIHNIVATNDDGEDIKVYTLVDLQLLSFATDRDKSLRYFSSKQTNAFRLTQTGAPIPEVSYSISPVRSSIWKDVYKVILIFNNVNEVTYDASKFKDVYMSPNDASLPQEAVQCGKISLVEGTKNQYEFSFNVDRNKDYSSVNVTPGMREGLYSLNIPKGTFSWKYNGNNIELPEISYSIDTRLKFKYDYQTSDREHTVYYHTSPNLSGYNRDIDLANFILMINGLYNIGISDKTVRIMDVYEQFTFAEGHFIPYEDPEYPMATLLKFVLEEPIIEGSFEPGKYCFVVDRGTFGDENFAKWLNDPTSIEESECHVNYAMDQIINVNNDRVSIQMSPDNLSDITKLSQITITLPYHENIEIPEDATIVARNYDYDNPHIISCNIERVEGTTNSFRFTSDETLRFSEDADARRYSFVIPKGFFKCGTVQIPSYDDTMFFYYAAGGADAIEGVNASQQDEIIFDLSGRRVKDTSKAGIYIINGKKILVK